MPNTDHLSMEYPDVLDLDGRDVRRLERFEELIWTSPEVCNECFSQVRHIEPADITLSETSLRNLPDAVHERTPHSEAAWSGYETPTHRYGQTWCLECGSDLSSQTHSQPLEALKERAKNIVEYTVIETDIVIGPRQMGKQLVRLNRRRELQGYDKQVLAVAWARAIETNASHPEERSVSGSVFAD